MCFVCFVMFGIFFCWSLCGYLFVRDVIEVILWIKEKEFQFIFEDYGKDFVSLEVLFYSYKIFKRNFVVMDDKVSIFGGMVSFLSQRKYLVVILFLEDIVNLFFNEGEILWFLNIFFFFSL